MEKIKEFGAETLSQTELKEKFITCEDYEKIRIYINPKENKDEKSKNSKSLDELLNEAKNLYGEEYFDEIEEDLDSFLMISLSLVKEINSSKWYEKRIK